MGPTKLDPRLPRTPAVHNEVHTAAMGMNDPWDLLRASFSLGWGPMSVSSSAGQLLSVPLGDGNVIHLNPTLSPGELHNLIDEDAKKQVREQVMTLQQQLQNFMERLNAC
jgi:hypothetical protein